MLAAEVLPDSVTSRAMTAWPAPSFSASGSMIRRLAWCSTTPASSSGATPAFSQAWRAMAGSRVVAQR